MARGRRRRVPKRQNAISRGRVAPKRKMAVGSRISPSVEWKRKKALGGRIAGSDVASKRKRRHKKRKKQRPGQRGR